MAGEATYFFGYCTWYVAHELWWVRGGWGNAYQWAGRAQAQGFALTLTPTVGAVVVYGPGHGYSEWGHVAIVDNVFPGHTFLVREMDAVAWDVVSTRVSNLYGVTAFILPPGVPAGDRPSTQVLTQPPAVESIAGAWAGTMDVLGRRLGDAIGYAGYIAGQLRAIV